MGGECLRIHEHILSTAMRQSDHSLVSKNKIHIRLRSMHSSRLQNCYGCMFIESLFVKWGCCSTVYRCAKIPRYISDGDSDGNPVYRFSSSWLYVQPQLRIHVFHWWEHTGVLCWCFDLSGQHMLQGGLSMTSTLLTTSSLNSGGVWLFTRI